VSISQTLTLQENATANPAPLPPAPLPFIPMAAQAVAGNNLMPGSSGPLTLPFPYWLPLTAGSTLQLRDSTNLATGPREVVEVKEIRGTTPPSNRRNLFFARPLSSTAPITRPFVDLLPGPVYKRTATDPPSRPFTTEDWRIVRAPRPLAGEEVLSLPQDIGIDVSTVVDAANGRLRSVTSLLPNHPFRTVTVPNPANGQPITVADLDIDLLFSPSGEVLRRNGTLGTTKTIYWVNDGTLDTNVFANPLPVFHGDQIAVVVYGHSALIESQPVDVNQLTGSYFGFTQDGRSSGL
jgi:hypothetical protein